MSLPIDTIISDHLGPFRQHPKAAHFEQQVDPSESLDLFTREDLAVKAWMTWRAGLRRKAAQRSRARRQAKAV